MSDPTREGEAEVDWDEVAAVLGFPPDWKERASAMGYVFSEDDDAAGEI